MALGGGIFLTQNKTLPGSYLNFVSASRASAGLSDRGVATMPLPLDWGPEGQIVSITAGEFQKDSLKLLGYPYTHEKLKGLRDLFQNIRQAYLFRLNAGGTAAASDYAAACWPGARGNALKLVIEAGEGSTESVTVYDVSTYLDDALVDVQKGVKTAADLRDNDFVAFKKDAVLSLTAGQPLAGGTDGPVQDGAYQAYLDKVEAYSFNVLGCLATGEAVKGLMANFTRRMRDECGVKFQCVLFRYPGADYEGVISVENGLEGAKDDPGAVYWVTGAEAGCPVNKSRTNAKYGGEYAIDTDYTQAQLEDGLKAGKLLFHRVGDEVRMLEDVNTFVSATDDKSADFSSNQTVRVLDQIGNDIAVLFNTKYLGQVPNDNAGRISLWADIVKHHQELQTLRAIQNFTGEAVTVEAGESKKAVVVTDHVEPVSAMAQLYMTVIVE